MAKNDDKSPWQVYNETYSSGKSNSNQQTTELVIEDNQITDVESLYLLAVSYKNIDVKKAHEIFWYCLILGKTEAAYDLFEYFNAMNNFLDINQSLVQSKEIASILYSIAKSTNDPRTEFGSRDTPSFITKYSEVKTLHSSIMSAKKNISLAETNKEQLIERLNCLNNLLEIPILSYIRHNQPIIDEDSESELSGNCDKCYDCIIL
ncbi:MAG: hypothetical protein HRU35_04800 [Rickettsiaceae bacterium]|nr:hypothetical protein [Rickettsiaceae bacterium]